ncbi:putative tRNA A64-2'-O-ribosylphosphate transferase [Podospora australis]|uniref:tRNA A64-2'-O-ribosylphosphate transferase n=1 Tax=Podospora australis TaxID=1536484 RepID=A0AAN6X0K6_9PEZI|nr:putative tRNA A64-2'-O-ribosylphosphate transferase [Podospora australis]
MLNYSTARDNRNILESHQTSRQPRHLPLSPFLPRRTSWEKMSAPTLADIVFPSQANGHNFSRILGDLKRSNLSITNRLNSIKHDAEFVSSVAAALNLPLVANERCGSWYIDPSQKGASAYFKSTDGHTGQWKFSTRRLNLHLLEVIGGNDGCIIVDSTRRGKRHPDALSKTVPTWCAVLNRVLFPEDISCHGLHVPPNTVSESEASQISARLSEFVDSFLSLAIDVTPLRTQISKPLRPLWVTQDDDDLLSPEGGLLSGEIAKKWHPVVCCTSSRRVVGTELGERGYIQGAGDDTENWALGLTAPIWWRHKEELLKTPEGELPDFIERLVAAEANGAGEEEPETRRVAPGLYVGTLQALGSSLTTTGACVVSLLPKATEQTMWVKLQRHIEVGLGKSKAASRALRDALPRICEFVSGCLKKQQEDERTEKEGEMEKKRVILLCETGKDLSVGVALALYCWCFDAEGKVRTGEEVKEGFNKTAIRVKLGHIMTAVPDANPSRATLQSVNSFLMDWRK